MASGVIRKKDLGDAHDSVLKRACMFLRACRRKDLAWRERARKGVRYYFGDQWEQGEKAQIHSRGQAPTVENFVQPNVRLMLGMMTSQPYDLVARSVGSHDSELSRRITAGLKHILDQNRAKMHFGKTLFSGLTYGMGVLHTGLRVRDYDPRTEPVQFVYVDPNHIRIDPDSRMPDLSDARYVLYSKSVLLSDAVHLMPEHEQDLRQSVGLGDPNLGPMREMPSLDGSIEYRGYTLYTPPVYAWPYSMQTRDYANDEEQPRVVLHELWERRPVKVWLATRSDGTTFEVDPTDPADMLRLMDKKVVRYEECNVPKVFVTTFTENAVLFMRPSPYKHDQLPFVPYFYDMDEYGQPVSMVETMKDVQDEINKRRSKLLYELIVRNYVVSPNLLSRMNMTLDEFRDYAATPGAVFEAEPEEIQIRDNLQASAQQYTLLQDSKSTMRLVTGVNNDMMGYDSAQRSGKAKEIQIEQGQITQRPADVNWRLTLQMLGEQLVSLMAQYHREPWLVNVTDDVGRTETLTLNERYTDPNGNEQTLYDITSQRFSIALDVQPWTPSLKAQAMGMLEQLAVNEPDPRLRTMLKRLALEMSDLPKKDQVLEAYDQVLGEVQAAAAQQGQPGQAVSQPAPEALTQSLRRQEA